MRSPNLFLFLSMARTLRKIESGLRKQNELLEKLILHLNPAAPEALEVPDLLYSDDELDAIEEMREELKLRGYKVSEKTG